jgi:hypothetical protein
MENGTTLYDDFKQDLDKKLERGVINQTTYDKKLIKLQTINPYKV